MSVVKKTLISEQFSIEFRKNSEFLWLTSPCALYFVHKTNLSPMRENPKDARGTNEAISIEKYILKGTRDQRNIPINARDNEK